MFDIDEPRYRRSLKPMVAARRGKETVSVSNDERAVICKNRRPITISRPRADVCQLARCGEEERRRGCVSPAFRLARQRVSANGKAASLSLSAVTTRFVGWHPERSCRGELASERANERVHREQLHRVSRASNEGGIINSAALLSRRKKNSTRSKGLITGVWFKLARVSTKTAAGCFVSFFSPDRIERSLQVKNWVWGQTITASGRIT